MKNETPARIALISLLVSFFIGLGVGYVIFRPTLPINNCCDDANRLQKDYDTLYRLHQDTVSDYEGDKQEKSRVQKW